MTTTIPADGAHEPAPETSRTSRRRRRAPADGVQQPAPAASRTGRRGRRILLGVGAALLAGIVAGLAARGLMRLAVLAIGGDPSFSPVATAMICLFFGLIVVPGTVARAMGARRTAVVLLVVGTALVALQSVMIGSQDLADADLTGTALAAVTAIVVAFAAVVVGLGVLAWRLSAAIARR